METLASLIVASARYKVHTKKTTTISLHLVAKDSIFGSIQGFLSVLTLFLSGSNPWQNLSTHPLSGSRDAWD